MKLTKWLCMAAVALLPLAGFAQDKAKAAPEAAKAAPAAAAAPAAVAEAAKPVPPLAAGSTAAPGWNNPPNWNEISTKPGYASVPGQETNVLIQDAGHRWRALRNGPVTFYMGWLIVIIPALLVLFYMVKGPFKLHDKPTGRLIERFNSAERVAHWTMAISFVALAISGVVMMFGKYVLMPVLGASVFATITVICKNIHNFVGPLFMFSLVVFFVLYVKDNFLSGADFNWLSKFGGLLSGKEVPSGRFNGGEKAWFWLSIVVFGIAISVTGLILLFPNWNTSRELMGQANIIHGVVAGLFIAASFAHIYMGTAGTEGAYNGMREGFVDETWAKEHHALWYEEVKSGKRPEKLSGAPQPVAGDD